MKSSTQDNIVYCILACVMCIITLSAFIGIYHQQQSETEIERLKLNVVAECVLVQARPLPECESLFDSWEG